MKKQLILLTIASLTALSCGSREDEAAARAAQQYEVVQEGSAAGVTATLGDAGVPPLTGTNADTTTSFTLDPNAVATTTGAQPGTIAGTLPPPMTSQSASGWGTPSSYTPPGSTPARAPRREPAYTPSQPSYTPPPAQPSQRPAPSEPESQPEPAPSELAPAPATDSATAPAEPPPAPAEEPADAPAEEPKKQPEQTTTTPPS